MCLPGQKRQAQCQKTEYLSGTWLRTRSTSHVKVAFGMEAGEALTHPTVAVWLVGLGPSLRLRWTHLLHMNGGGLIVCTRPHHDAPASHHRSICSAAPLLLRVRICRKGPARFTSASMTAVHRCNFLDTAFQASGWRDQPCKHRAKPVDACDSGPQQHFISCCDTLASASRKPAPCPEVGLRQRGVSMQAHSVRST